MTETDERLRRWRLILGGEEADGTGFTLGGADLPMDRALGALYDAAPGGGSGRRAGLGASAPNIARWLGDIREYFPAPVVRVIQQDALERLRLRQKLLAAEPLPR